MFVFTSISTYYYYQKEIAPIFHHALKKSLNSNQEFILFLFASCSFLTFMYLDLFAKLIICFLIIIGILYHNHTSYFIFRKLILWKNIIIGLSWIGMCLLSFNFNQYLQFDFWIIVLIFFKLVFIQSILFDYVDIKKDETFKHATFASRIVPKNLFKIIRYLSLSILVVLIFLTLNERISYLGFLLNFTLLSVYYSNLYNYIKSQQAHLIYFTDIIFLLFSLSFHL